MYRLKFLDWNLGFLFRVQYDVQYRWFLSYMTTILQLEMILDSKYHYVRLQRLQQLPNMTWKDQILIFNTFLDFPDLSKKEP